MKLWCLSQCQATKAPASVGKCADIARAFAAHIHIVWVKMQTQTKIKASRLPEYVSMDVSRRLLCICDTYQNLKKWPMYSTKVSLFSWQIANRYIWALTRQNLSKGFLTRPYPNQPAQL